MLLRRRGMESRTARGRHSELEGTARPWSVVVKLDAKGPEEEPDFYT
jgi:hypothetical protein